MQHTFQPVVLAVIVKDGKVLLTQRNDQTADGNISEFHNMWQLPGGSVEFGEKLEEALQRECREEIGVDIIIKKPAGYVDTVTMGTWQGVFIPFLCELKHPRDTIVINEEASAYRWVLLEDTKSMDTMPLASRILSTVIELI